MESENPGFQRNGPVDDRLELVTKYDDALNGFRLTDMSWVCIYCCGRRWMSSPVSGDCSRPSNRLFHETHNCVFSLFAHIYQSYVSFMQLNWIECTVCEIQLEYEVEGSVPSGVERPVPSEVAKSVSESLVDPEEDCGRNRRPLFL